MKTLRKNTIKSFQHVKQHIAQLEHALIENQADIAQLRDQLQSLTLTLSQLNGSLDKVVTKPKKPSFLESPESEELVSSTTGASVHKLSCAWAKHIKGKRRRIFFSLAEAKEAGLKLCKACLK